MTEFEIEQIVDAIANERGEGGVSKLARASEHRARILEEVAYREHQGARYPTGGLRWGVLYEVLNR